MLVTKLTLKGKNNYVSYKEYHKRKGKYLKYSERLKDISPRIMEKYLTPNLF